MTASGLTSNPQMEQIYGWLPKGCAEAAIGPTCLEMASRSWTRLRIQTGKASSWRSLEEDEGKQKEFDREIKDEEARTPPDVNKQLNDEKQSMQ
ncbi:putative plant SNARE 13 [Drosera capensis]